ncbi:MAG: hypothetical protein ACOZCL_11785 [Bacillota bacterium]
MKKILSILLIALLIFSLNCSVFADGGKEGKKGKDEEKILIDSHMFYNTDSKSSKDEPESSIIAPRVIVYEPGTVRIDDYLCSEGGWFNAENKSFTSFETFKIAAIKVVTNIPVIGQYIETGIEIYDALKAVCTDLSYIDKSKQTTVDTKYTYRDFYHDLYCYDYNNSWKTIGYSLSRYYYKNLAMRYYNSNIGEYRDANYYFTHSNGYSPCYIAEAANHKNYSQLNSLTYEAWVYNRSYYETY